jgi:hypothetical protein
MEVNGSFLVTATELETDRRIGSRFMQLIWNSSSFENDIVGFAEAFEFIH